MSPNRQHRYRPSFLTTPGVEIASVLRFPLELGRPCAVLPDGSIVTRPKQRDGGAVRLFARNGRELDALEVEPYSTFEPCYFPGAAVLVFRSAASGTWDAFAVLSGNPELRRFSHVAPTGYSQASRTFFTSEDEGSQLYTLPLEGAPAPRWGSTIGLGMIFGGMDGFDLHPSSEHAAVAFGSYHGAGGWHSRLGIHVPKAAGLEYLRLSSHERDDRIRFVQWVGDEAWWVTQDGTVYAWSGDGRPRDRWAESSVAPRALCRLGYRITQVAAFGNGMLAAGGGRLVHVRRDGHVTDALGATPMSFESSWYVLGDRYVTVRSEGGKNELAIRELGGSVAARVRVKPSGWPDARGLQGGGFAFTSEASSYVDVVFCTVTMTSDAEPIAPELAPERVHVMSAALHPDPNPSVVQVTAAPSMRGTAPVPPLPSQLSPDWFRLRTGRRDRLPFAFRPEHPTTLASRDMAIFAAGMPEAAREVFDESLLDAFEYSWRSVAAKVGELPAKVDLEWAKGAAGWGWLSHEFRSWGDLLAVLWAWPSDREPLVTKCYPADQERWAIPRAHWYLGDGVPKVYRLEELVLCERIFAEVDADADDPWDVYPALTVPNPNLGPQFAEDEGLVLPLPAGWGFRGRERSYFGENHDELRRQRTPCT